MYATATHIIIPTLLTSLSLALGCTGSDPNADRRVPALPLPPGGKADSYVNTSAAEYRFAGTVHMATPDGLDSLTGEEAEARLAEAAEKRLTKVASAIHSYLKTRAKELNDEIPSELPDEIAEAIADEDEETKRRVLENWRTQHEVSAATRSTVHHLETIRQDTDGTYMFDFEVEGLLSDKLASAVFSETSTFEITVTQGDAPQSETVAVTASRSPSTDGYPRYDQLFADGVFDVAVHIGGDYNQEEVEICCPVAGSEEPSCQTYECANSCEPAQDECSMPAPAGCTREKVGGRVDRSTAERLVEILKDQGFAHPALTHLDLTIDSPPFTKTYDFNGTPVEVRVKVVYPEIVACGDEDQLVDSMIDSLASKELIVYAGHAGPGAGFLLDYQPRVQLDDSEWKSLSMPNTYQMIAMYGCKTYSTYADAVYDNPAKNDENLDVVTTVNTMWTNMGLPGTTSLLFGMLLQETESRRHVPVSWLSLLSWLNLQEQNAHTHYGIHGVDSKPKMSPWVDPADLCAACAVDTDCEGGGNFCLSFPDGTSGCGAVCTDSSGCGDLYSCVAIPGLEDSVIPKMCIPNNVTCQQP